MTEILSILQNEQRTNVGVIRLNYKFKKISKLLAQAINRRLGMLGLTFISSKVVVKRMKMLSNLQTKKFTRFEDA